jgi:putative addiction module component (TIGR02574 family)
VITAGWLGSGVFDRPQWCHVVNAGGSKTRTQPRSRDRMRFWLLIVATPVGDNLDGLVRLTKLPVKDKDMPRTIDLDTIQSLSLVERLNVLGEIWDSIDQERHAVELTADLRDELDRRIAEDDASPDEGITWEQVKANIRDQR